MKHVHLKLSRPQPSVQRLYKVSVVWFLLIKHIKCYSGECWELSAPRGIKVQKTESHIAPIN